jgi:hypothetical protein
MLLPPFLGGQQWYTPIYADNADLFDDFVMANGRPDHSIPPHCALQLGSMLNLEVT